MPRPRWPGLRSWWRQGRADRPDRSLRQLLGRDLGVAITGAEDLGLTLVLTEGFGRIRMADRAWSLLGKFAGSNAAVSGATQIRAGVMRPEILIPHETMAGELDVAGDGGLEIGSLVRAIREPHFGRIVKTTIRAASDRRKRGLFGMYGNNGQRQRAGVLPDKVEAEANWNPKTTI